jgi:cell wall-associated NlpC family hydrolase
VSAAARAACGWAAAILLALPTRAEVVPVWPADLAAPRRELLTKALALLKAHPAVPYVEGGAGAEGMDCSGATTAMLKQVGIVPPRSSHGQYEWLKESGRLTVVPASARTADDPVFRTLRPGDLIFWARDGAEVFRVSHVHLYLGKEADGHAVMIGSSDGRSYRGKKLHGFGIVDYRVPPAGSATRIVGFGSPLPAAAKSPPD